MKKLILVRHGESEWNKMNLFTGWTDVDLTPYGMCEAYMAGRLLKEEGYRPTMCYTSYLKRAVKTLNQILDAMDMDYLPVEKSWRLNEKSYGALQGANKAETLKKYGEEKLMRMVGRMKYRSSYGQNLLQHSREVANLAATMASELGLNPKLAKRAGLLHDIGKVPETDPELPHAIFGMKLAEKYKEHPDVCNAIGAHHDETEMTNLISPIIQVCDAISGARPGARREVVEAYINRLKKLEDMAMTYPGVVKTYAIQAGRELRVIVGADKVSDADATKLSFDLSRQIQNEMTYPGQIKVTVIRETRAVNYAK